MAFILVLFTAACSGKSIERMEAQDFIISSPFLYAEMDFTAFYEMAGKDKFLNLAEDSFSSVEPVYREMIIAFLDKLEKVYFYGTSDMFDSGYAGKVVTLIESHEMDFSQIYELLKTGKEEYTSEEYRGFSYIVTASDDSDDGIFIFYNDNCIVVSMNREMFLAGFDAALSGKNIRKNSSIQEQKKAMKPAEIFAAMQDMGFIKQMGKTEALGMLDGLKSGYFSMNVRDQGKGLFSIIMENEDQAAMLKMLLGIAISPAAVDAAEQYLPPESGGGLIEVYKSFKVTQNSNAVDISFTVTREMINQMIDSIPGPPPADAE